MKADDTHVNVIAGDVMAIYGPLAKAFALQRVCSDPAKRDGNVQAFWKAVADIIWQVDPDASAGCPVRADMILLH